MGYGTLPWYDTGLPTRVVNGNEYVAGRGRFDTGLCVNGAEVVRAKTVTFTETTGAGTYTGTVNVPAGSVVHDVIVSGVSLWAASTSASMIVGDATDDNGYFDAVNLKATDLLAGEDLSFALAGGKAGAYIAGSQANARYAAAARTITGKVTTVGASGATGVTRMTVIYSQPKTEDVTAATKV